MQRFELLRDAMVAGGDPNRIAVTETVSKGSESYRDHNYCWVP